MMESKSSNDLFYTCSLIEYIARKTKNKKSLVVSKLGLDNINKIYKLADIYHCDNIDKVSDEFISYCNINNGDYDILKNISNYPSYYDIGKVYKRLIIGLSSNEEEYIDKLIEVFNSFIIEKLDNYNSSLYYENPGYILYSYKEGKLL